MDTLAPTALDDRVARAQARLLREQKPDGHFVFELEADATAKWEGEGYTRGWPEVNRIPAGVKAAVDARWASFGIDMPGHVR